MSDKIKLTTTISSSPDIIYSAWLNTKEHTLFTNSAARISPKVGGKFMAWDGYISGKNILLEEKKK